MLEAENCKADGFILSQELDIQDVLNFQNSHPQFSMAALVLRAKTEGLRAPKMTDVRLHSRTLSQDEAHEALRNTHREARESRNRFLTSERHDELLNILLVSAEKTEAQIVEFSNQNRMVGLMMYRPLEYLESKCTLVSWIWRDKNVSHETQLAFRFQIYEILRNQPWKYVLSTVHIANERSLRFCEQLGLKTLCIVKQY
jgi:hypothetical protein